MALQVASSQMGHRVGLVEVLDALFPNHLDGGEGLVCMCDGNVVQKPVVVGVPGQLQLTCTSRSASTASNTLI